MINKDIGTRMKGYEATSQGRFIDQLPIIVRIDGKAFHTFTKQNKCVTPFDDNLHDSMVYAMCKTMSEIMQNSVLGYTQSDEISILLKNWPDFNTEQWFGGKIQKIASISASAITAHFNDRFNGSTALFDARAFQLPITEVANYFIWRQQDAERNSVQMYARSFFSHKAVQGLSCPQLVDKIFDCTGYQWGHLDTWKKRGTAVTQDMIDVVSCKAKNLPSYYDCPVFTKERDFIEDLLSSTIK